MLKKKKNRYKDKNNINRLLKELYKKWIKKNNNKCLVLNSKIL